MLRSAILRGPAVITYNGATFYSKDDIQCMVDEETFEIMTSTYGPVDERQKERKAEITFTPCGEWETTAISVLWPYGTALVGSSIFGSDKTLTINCQDGKQLIFSAAAVTKSPSLILSATKTMIGSVTFTCIGKENTAWSVANSFVAISEGASFPASTLDPAVIWTAPWTAVWGALGAPWDNIQTVDGWTIDFNLSVTPFEVDKDGIIDYTLDKLDVTAKCKPVAVKESDIVTAMQIQGTSAARGRSLQAVSGGSNLVFSSSGAAAGLTVYSAAPRKAPFLFGSVVNRVGELEFVAARKLSGGVMQPLFAIA